VVGSTEWQRLKSFEKVHTLLKHLDGIANYRRTKVRMGVVEAVNGNIRMLIDHKSGMDDGTILDHSLPRRAPAGSVEPASA
jgi:hypothetical protein